MANYQDVTNFANKLIEQYDKYVYDLMGLTYKTYKDFSVNKKPYKGKGWYVDIHTGGNREALRAGLESEALPSPYRERFNQFVVPVRFVASQIELSEKVILVSKGGGSVGPDAAMTEVKGAFNNIMSNLEIATFGYGESVLSRVGATATSTALQTKAPDYARNIFKNDLIDVVTALGGAGTVEVNGIAVSHVDYDTGIITLATSSTFTADSYIVRAAHQDSDVPTDGFDIMGLSGIVDDGTNVATFQNVARTGASRVDEAKGNVLDNDAVARPLTLELLQQGIDKVEFSLGGDADAKGIGNDFVWYVDESQRRALAKIQWPARIYMGSPNDAGTKGQYTFDGFKIEKRRHCPANTWFGIKKSDIQYFELAPIGFLKGYTGEDANMVWVDSYLLQKGVCRVWCNLGSPAPNHHIKVGDVKGS